jgi:hypothetical protein
MRSWQVAEVGGQGQDQVGPGAAGKLQVALQQQQQQQLAATYLLLRLQVPVLLLPSVAGAIGMDHLPHVAMLHRCSAARAIGGCTG